MCSSDLLGNDQYFQYPTNSQNGATTSFWVNRIRTPTINLWPVPNDSYQFIVYNGIRYIQDIGDYFNSVDVPPRFIQSATAGLAVLLAQKYAPDKVDVLQTSYDAMYLEAGREDTENVNSLITWAMGEA